MASNGVEISIGERDAVTFGIHQKTSLGGGYLDRLLGTSWPDAGYLDRLASECLALGIATADGGFADSLC